MFLRSSFVGPPLTSPPIPIVQAISPRDAPLVAFMSSVAGALGMDGIFRMRESAPAGDSGFAAAGGEATEGVLSRDAATEFYENFLVPRLVASSSSSAAAAAAGVDALKTIAERFLLEEDGEKGER